MALAMNLRLPHRIAMIASVLFLSACSLSKVSQPRVTITPIEDLPFKELQPREASSECPLPLIYAEPLTDFRKIAIVEGYGKEGQDQDVIAATQHAACDTGADALLVVSSVLQDGSNPNPQIGQQSADALTRSSSDTAKLMLSGVLLKGEKPTLPGREGFFLEEYAIVYTDRNRPATADSGGPSPTKSIASYTQR
jgi:hypothetical protein